MPYFPITMTLCFRLIALTIRPAWFLRSTKIGGFPPVDWYRLNFMKKLLPRRSRRSHQPSGLFSVNPITAFEQSIGRFHLQFIKNYTDRGPTVRIMAMPLLMTWNAA
jgi:hypothetical protein